MTPLRLFPDEETIIHSYDLGAIADLDARLFKITSGDANPLTIAHKLDRVPGRFLVTRADKTCTVWQASITSTSFALHRSDGTAYIELLVF